MSNPHVWEDVTSEYLAFLLENWLKWTDYQNSCCFILLLVNLLIIWLHVPALMQSQNKDKLSFNSQSAPLVWNNEVQISASKSECYWTHFMIIKSSAWNNNHRFRVSSCVWNAFFFFFFPLCENENYCMKVESSSALTSLWPRLKYIWSVAVLLCVHFPPLFSLSCGPDGTLSALWATAIEAWLYCNVRGCSGHTGRQEALGEMDGWERWGGQIGQGDKGTMAARVPSRLVVEWPLQGSLEAGPPLHRAHTITHTHTTPPQHTAGCRRWGRR